MIGAYTSTLTKIQIGGAGERICQARHIRLRTSRAIPIQIDGEPSKLCASVIDIRHKNRALMLEHVKFNTDSPLLGYHATGLTKSFQVKCVLKSEYALNRYRPSLLEKHALFIGILCTAHYTEPLCKVKPTVSMLINNCASGFHTDHWTFLNGDEFYRVAAAEDADECLLDIVSAQDDIVYILDEQAHAQSSAIPPSIVINSSSASSLSSKQMINASKSAINFFASAECGFKSNASAANSNPSPSSSSSSLQLSVNRSMTHLNAAFASSSSSSSSSLFHS